MARACQTRNGRASDLAPRPDERGLTNGRSGNERDAGKRIDGPTSAERDELVRLRRENHRLRQERDILAKAAAWFARESKASPNGFTGS